MSLYTLLAFLGLSIFGARDYPVVVVDLPDLGGVACRADFRDVPGNAQYLCPDGFEGILIARSTLRAGTQFTLQTLWHEARHLELGPTGPVHDPFREVEIHHEACEAFPTSGCKED